MSRKSKSRRPGAPVTLQHRQPLQQERRQPEAHASTHRWVFRLLPVLIALVTVVPFLPTLDNQFVNWDDDDNLVENPQYRGLGWTHLRWMWTTSHIGHYAPLTWMTFGLDFLSGLFYPLALLVYLRAGEQGERGRSGYWASVGLFVCALLSKSMAVSLPVVLLILDVYPLRRLGGARGWWGEPARRIYLEKIPFVLLALAASGGAFIPQIEGRNMPSLDEISVLGRLAVSAYGLRCYL